MEKPIIWKELGKRIVGDVGLYSLFYIHDLNYGGGTLRYQLEARFTDQRWSSNSIDELKKVATKQMEEFHSNITL